MCPCIPLCSERNEQFVMADLDGIGGSVERNWLKAHLQREDFSAYRTRATWLGKVSGPSSPSLGSRDSELPLSSLRRFVGAGMNGNAIEVRMASGNSHPGHGRTG